MPKEKFIKINNGVIIEKRPTDYQLGSSPIEKEILVPDGNWKNWKPEHEIQWTGVYDTLMCVTFSATDVLEYLFTWALHSNKIRPENVLWLKNNGYFKNGLINFNERFTATLGETTTNGAYQYKVGDAIRKYGLIPQDLFPMADNFFDNIDKKFITQKMYDLGAEFIKRFPVGYEWASNMRLAIKYAPLQVCVYYQNGVGLHCPIQNPNHAVEAVYIEDDFIEIGDSYFDEFKKYCPEKVYSAMLYTINFKFMDTNKWLKDNDLKWVRNKDTGSFGRVLQGELKTFQTTDRACLALLDDRVRENGVQIDNNLWGSLPKNNF